jgi:hypothetical protein
VGSDLPVYALGTLLGAKKSGGGVYSCVADGVVSRHPPLNAIKVADAYRLIDSASCNRHLKSVLRPLVAANRGRFSRMATCRLEVGQVIS